MWAAGKWKDYELIDCGEGLRLERWGTHNLIRPDPVAIWDKSDPGIWNKFDAKYIRSETGGGHWDVSALPVSWQINYSNFKFIIKPMGFKHTGLFPEQAANWDWASSLIKNADRPISVLNLFAYTGGATISAASAGASVCHVDAARGIVSHAKENAAVSSLTAAPIRYIVDDCVKFAAREIRRGNRYDAIILDPPSYGRGPGGEVWKIDDSLYPLLKLCRELLSSDPLFFLLNSYTAGLSPSSGFYTVSSLLSDIGGKTEAGEIGIPVTASGKILPCGTSVRHIFKESGNV